LSLVMAREQDHLRSRRALLECARRIETVEEGHADVENRDVGGDGRYEADHLLTVGCLAGYLKSFSFQQRPQGLADECVVVCEDDTNRHFTFPPECRLSA